MNESLDRFEELICDLEGVPTSAKIRKEELAKVIASQIADELRSTCDDSIFSGCDIITSMDLQEMYDQISNHSIQPSVTFISKELWEEINNENK